MNLRQFYLRSDFEDFVLLFVVFGVFFVFSLLIPTRYLQTYELMLFALGFLHLLLVTDKMAWMPFAMIHTVFANGFAILLSVVLLRMAWSSHFLIPSVLIYFLLAWWASVLFHFFTSESFVFSYLGGIERQMGMMFRTTVPVYVFTAWQVSRAVRYFPFEIIVIGAILESVVVTLQFLEEEHYVHYPFSYLKSIGFRRYTGTISNPIPVANFLLTALPLTFAFYKTGFEFIFFILAYSIISWGLVLSHGRGSFMSTAFITLLEIVYILFHFLSLPLTLIALTTVIFWPTFYLFTQQGEVTKNKLKDVVNFFKNKKTDTSETHDKSKPASSSVNRAFIWRESIKSFKEHPWLGYGISNIARALRRRFSRKSAAYFMTQVVDRSHNHYLDLLLEGGLTHLAAYIALLGASVYLSFITSQAWLAIAVVGYSLEVLFSFPLQINYTTLLIIVSMAAPMMNVKITWLPFVFGALIMVYVFNLYISSRENVAMRYIQLATSIQRQGDVQVTLDSVMSALRSAPFEQRFFTQASSVLENLSSTGKLKMDDLHLFRIWFNASKDFLLKVGEAPDVPFSTMAMVYASAFSKTNDKMYGNECWTLTKLALKMNPSSLTARRSLFMLLTTLSNIHEKNKNKAQSLLNLKQAQAVVKGMVNDFLNSPAANYDLENGFWQALFDLTRKLGKVEELSKYFEIYKKRFEGVLFTYDIFTKISKVFNTPVGWTHISTDGVRTLHPVNTVMGPLVKRVWKFSHGRSVELYLTVGKDAKVSEAGLKPFMDEFMKREDFSRYWKDEGYIGDEKKESGEK